MQTQFNTSLISVIEVFEERCNHYTWLPRKQKTIFFGLIKRKKWHNEGWYSSGCYYEGYMGDSWDATPCSREDLEKMDYIVKNDKTVWHKPYVNVHLGPKEGVCKKFESYQEALSWAEKLRNQNGGNFEIVVKK